MQRSDAQTVAQALAILSTPNPISNNPPQICGTTTNGRICRP